MLLDRGVTLWRMGRIALLAGLLFAGTASAHVFQVGHWDHVPARHAVLVAPDGQPVGGRWQQWIDQSRIPTVIGDITLFKPQSFCGYTGPALGMGCSLFAAPYREIAASDRDSLYWELGHQFDWLYLTRTDRRYLAREWGRPYAHWWDTQRALADGGEDGLEAEFAAVYRDCAWGVNDKGATVASDAAGSNYRPPQIVPRINTCAFIRRVASTPQPARTAAG